MLEKLKNRQFLIDVALFPFAFFVISLLITSFKPEGPILFRYDQIAIIQDGEWWRVLTAHFTHSTWNHFLLNMAGLVILSYLFSEVATWRRWLVLMIVGSLFCSAGFYFLGEPDYIYVGMSDVLHAVIIAYAMLDYKNFKLGNIILVLGTIAKVIWEQTPWYIEGSAEFIGGKVATESHFYGAVIGLILGSLFLLMERKEQARSSK